MLCLKRETDYAVQLLQHLAQKKEKLKSLNEFAQISGISFWFLQKIARKLHLAGIISAGQGVNGGYRLSQPSKKLNLLDIYEVMEGKMSISPCLTDPNCACCGKNKNCHLKKTMSKINNQLVKILKETKI